MPSQKSSACTSVLLVIMTVAESAHHFQGTSACNGLRNARKVILIGSHVKQMFAAQLVPSKQPLASQLLPCMVQPAQPPVSLLLPCMVQPAQPSVSQLLPCMVPPAHPLVSLLLSCMALLAQPLAPLARIMVPLPRNVLNSLHFTMSWCRGFAFMSVCPCIPSPMPMSVIVRSS